MKKKTKLKLILILPFSYLMFYISSFYPTTVENIYSNGIFRVISFCSNSVNGLIPISIAEILLLIGLISLIIYIIKTLVKLKKNKEKKECIINFLINSILIFTLLYLSFLVLWGFNYNRQSFANIAGYKVENVSISELEGVCKKLTIKINKIRKFVKVDEFGVMKVNDSKKEAILRTGKGYKLLGHVIQKLSGKHSEPKGVILSEIMSYEGISGIYSPFTGESNVNINNSDFAIPFTASHEVAHQKGFAREDEANFIAYLACKNHPDIDYQYSGMLMAYIYASNSLSSYDRKKSREIDELLNQGTKQDLIANYNHWKKYRGPIRKISSKINDTYLKANNQHYGVRSYGRMVDLLIAEHKKE